MKVDVVGGVDGDSVFGAETMLLKQAETLSEMVADDFYCQVLFRVIARAQALEATLHCQSLAPGS